MHCKQFVLLFQTIRENDRDLFDTIVEMNLHDFLFIWNLLGCPEDTLVDDSIKKLKEHYQGLTITTKQPNDPS